MRIVHGLLVAMLLLNLLVPTVARAAAGAPAPPLAAKAAVVFDRQTGRVLYAVRAHERLPIASLTKIVTALVALRLGRLDEPVTVPAGVTALPETKAEVHPGETFPLGLLLKVMLVRSANDIAETIAVHFAGSDARFGLLQTAFARELGLTDSQFRNPHGLDMPGHYSTAYDLAILADTALDNPAFRAWVQAPRASLDATRTFPSHNRLLRTYAGATGVKTGLTEDAGATIVGSARRGGRERIVVVLGAASPAAAAQEAEALLDWAFGSNALPMGEGRPRPQPGRFEQALATLGMSGPPRRASQPDVPTSQPAALAKAQKQRPPEVAAAAAGTAALGTAAAWHPLWLWALVGLPLAFALVRRRG